MTTDAEREFYYRLVRENIGKGEIVEFGAWLGASTAYIASAIRDSGADVKAHVYDKFLSKPGHVKKVEAFYQKHDKAIPTGPSLEQFKANLGPLLDHIEIHPGQIENMRWKGGPIAVLITDAPKRVPAISAVLTELKDALQPGSIMAWQDFCHFPSYEIPACLYRLRDHIEFVEAIVPGTTLAFRVKSQWSAEEVSLDALSLKRWSDLEICEAWNYWLGFVEPEKQSLFRCGAAMFLYDLGHHAAAVTWLDKVFWEDQIGIVKKWQYLADNRRDFVARYSRLFEYLKKQQAIRC